MAFDPHDVQVAIQVLAEHLSRAAADDVTEAAGLRARGRDGELEAIARVLARAVDAYGQPPARDVLAATDAPADLIETLDAR